MARSREKRKRRARRSKKEKASDRLRTGGRQRTAGPSFLGSVTLFLATLAGVTGWLSYGLIHDRIVAHGVCPACIFEGPFQLLVVALMLCFATILVALRWWHVRREIARRG